MERLKEMMTRKANRYRSDVEFQIGDLVFLSNKNIKSKRPSKKLGCKKDGPFEIIDKQGFDYILNLPQSMRHVISRFHPDLLHLASTDPLLGQKNLPPPPIMVDDQEEWVVDDIIDS